MFFIIALSFWKYSQIHKILFFFGITTIDDNRVALFISWMNLATNSLSMSCLMITTRFKFNLYQAWCINKIDMLNLIQCWAIFDGVLLRSLLSRWTHIWTHVKMLMMICSKVTLILTYYMDFSIFKNPKLNDISYDVIVPKQWNIVINVNYKMFEYVI